MKRTALVAVLLALPVLAGCNSNDVTASSETSSTTSSPAASDGSSSAAEGASGETTTAEESGQDDAKTKPFGSTFTWDDKLAITVSKPQPFTPSEYTATDSKFKKFVTMDVELKNGTSKVYETFSITLSGTSGDQQTDQIFDSANGVEMPTAKLLPGKSLKFKVAFGYTPGQDFTVVVNSIDDFNRADGIYTTKL
ncbi:hypothetical protein IEE94_13835 [Yimella sp. cx-573]|nr:hypothetical protein [Yimella sp. cx-573]